MARGVRKTTKERYQDDLAVYEKNAEKLKLELADVESKISEVKSKIELEEFREVTDLMGASGVNFEQLKSLISKSSEK